MHMRAEPVHGATPVVAVRDRTHRAVDLQPHTLVLLCLLIAADIVFGMLHLLWCCTASALSAFFSLDKDRGFAEIYQYVKAFWATLLLGAVAWRVRAAIYLAWCVVAVYLLVDDALYLHERLGRAAVAYFDLQGAWALRPTDYGELLVIGVVAAVLFLLVALAHRRADTTARADSRRLLQLLLLLGVFGVMFDLVHSIAGAGTPAALAALVEDGGEMVMMSLIATYAFEVCCRVHGGDRYAERAALRISSSASRAM